MQSSLTFEPNPFEQSFASKPSPPTHGHGSGDSEGRGGSVSSTAVPGTNSDIHAAAARAAAATSAAASTAASTSSSTASGVVANGPKDNASVSELSGRSRAKRRKSDNTSAPGATSATTTNAGSTASAADASSVGERTGSRQHLREEIPGIDKITTPLPLVPGELPGNPIGTPLPLTGSAVPPSGLGHDSISGQPGGVGANGSGQVTPGWPLRGTMTPGILGTSADLAGFHQLSRNPVLPSPGVASMLALPLDAARGGVTPGGSVPVQLSPSILGPNMPAHMAANMPPNLVAGMAPGMPGGMAGAIGGGMAGGMAPGMPVNGLTPGIPGGMAPTMGAGGVVAPGMAPHVAHGVAHGMAPGMAGMAGMASMAGMSAEEARLHQHQHELLHQRQANFDKSPNGPNGLYMLSNTAGDGSAGQGRLPPGHQGRHASTGSTSRAALSSQYSSPGSIVSQRPAQSSHSSIASSVDSSVIAAANANVNAKVKSEAYLGDEDDEPRKRSRKESISTEEGRRKQFLERNRLAAIKCRQRKKQYVDDLKAKTDFYAQAHERLSIENSKLHFQLDQLRQYIVSQHNVNELPAAVLQILEQGGDFRSRVSMATQNHTQAQNQVQTQNQAQTQNLNEHQHPHQHQHQHQHENQSQAQSQGQDLAQATHHPQAPAVGQTPAHIQSQGRSGLTHHDTAVHHVGHDAVLHVPPPAHVHPATNS